jgi:uncharacterized protein
MNKKDYIKIQKDIDAILDNDFTLEYIHGALTAILCAPEIIPPSEWLPLLTMKDGENIEFKTEDDASLIMGSFIGLYNDIAQSLTDYYPLFSLKSSPGRGQLNSDPETAQKWCNGFIGGMGLWHTDYIPDEKFREILMPVLIIIDSSVLLDNNPDLPQETIQELERESVQSVAETVLKLKKYDFSQAKSRKSIGRNEPCRCGSGKKY